MNHDVKLDSAKVIQFGESLKQNNLTRYAYHARTFEPPHGPLDLLFQGAIRLFFIQSGKCLLISTHNYITAW